MGEIGSFGISRPFTGYLTRQASDPAIQRCRPVQDNNGEMGVMDEGAKAKLAIAKILKELELSTGSTVSSIEIRDLDVTESSSAFKVTKRDVVIEMTNPAGVGW